MRAAVRDELERAFASRAQPCRDELERDVLVDVAGGELLALPRRAEPRRSTRSSRRRPRSRPRRASGSSSWSLSGAVKGYATGQPEGGPAAGIGWRSAIDLARARRRCPEVQVLAYAADVERVRLDLEAYRGALGDAPLSVVVRPTSPDCESPENLAAKVALARELG